MKIETVKVERMKSVGSIQAGTCFEYEDRVFMKLIGDFIADERTMPGSNFCAHVGSGEIVNLHHQIRVVPVEAKVVVEK